MSEQRTRHLRIRGRVQGVGYRFYMQHQAADLGITGWVRNRTDGSVEAVIKGSAQAVDAMIASAQRGPREAHVTGVDVSEDTGSYASFELRPTV